MTIKVVRPPTHTIVEDDQPVITPRYSGKILVAVTVELSNGERIVIDRLGEAIYVMNSVGQTVDCYRIKS